MQIVNLAANPIWLIVKLFFLVGLVVYLIFAIVVVKQVQIMTSTVKLEFELPIKILAVIHLIFAAAILIFAYLVL